MFKFNFLSKFQWNLKNSLNKIAGAHPHVSKNMSTKCDENHTDSSGGVADKKSIYSQCKNMYINKCSNSIFSRNFAEILKIHQKK